MDPNLLHLLVAGGLTLVGIVITAIIWRAAKVRTVVWWLGLSLIPVSIYLLGLTRQVEDAWTTLRAWYEGLTLTPLVWTGLGLFGLGVVLMLVSRVIPARPRKKADAAASGPPVGSATRAGIPAPTTTRPEAPAPSTQRRTTASQSTPADADLDEVTEILKRRGIS